MSDAASTDARRGALPLWAPVTDRRRAHILRVTALLEEWAEALQLSPEERACWRDAGLWHDALRDAPEETLRTLTGVAGGPVEILHGPAAATWLERHGEARTDVLEAVRHHTIGYPRWGRTGKALFMADFLEPGRRFLPTDRAFLARHVAADFDGVFRQTVRMRLQWSIGEGLELFPEMVTLWNVVR
jgi:HD superfamily phosphohydrolase YqeK